MPLLFIVAFLDLVGFGIIMPIIPALVHNYKLDTLHIGILVSVFPFAQFFGSIIMGYLSDIFGRKKILVISLFFLVCSYFFAGFVQTLSSEFYMILLMRLFIGFFSGNIAIIFATVSNFSTKEDLVKNMSYLGSAFTLGFIFGPIIGGYLSKDYNTVISFYFTGSFYFLSLILVTLFFKNPIITEDDCKQNNILKELATILKNPFVLFNLTLYIFFAFAFSGLEVFLLTQTLGIQMGYSPFVIGLVWTYFAIVSTIIQLFITKHLPKNFSLVGGLIILGIAVILLSFSHNIFILCLMLLLIAFGLGILFPNINAELSLQGGQKQKGLIFGINFSCESIGGFLGPYILSYIYSITGVIYSVWFVLGGLSLLLSIAAIIYLSNKQKVIQNGY